MIGGLIDAAGTRKRSYKLVVRVNALAGIDAAIRGGIE